MLTPRQIVQVRSWPDPLLQERLEDVGFFFDAQFHTWVRFVDPDEASAVTDYLERHHLGYEVGLAPGRGETRRLPRMSDDLLLRDGGGPARCALCGKGNTPCRQWVEGDDTDCVEYPGAARFYLCGGCVQTHVQQHPRLYSPVEETL
jgi:hypothetical protein